MLGNIGGAIGTGMMGAANAVTAAVGNLAECAKNWIKYDEFAALLQNNIKFFEDKSGEIKVFKEGH